MTRPDRRYLGLATKTAAKELLWFATCRHEQGDRPNILLFATRRGGSTFAMELIAANRGIRSLDQPLELLGPSTTAAQAARVPIYRQGQITSLDESSERQLRSLMDDIFTGRVVINAPTRFWRRDASLRSDRLVLKILDAKPVIDWFDVNLDCQIVYLTRHPIPQALSCLRNGWSLTAHAYLADDRFVEANLSPGALALAHDTVRGGTDLRRFVVNWALENVAPTRLLPDHPDWIHVRYEDCVTDPTGTLDRLAGHLDLPDVDRMREIVSRPSVSSRRSTSDTRSTIESGRASEVVSRWRDEVDPADRQWCDRLLETFGIDPAIVTG
jgi:hypothetical protein